MKLTLKKGAIIGSCAALLIGGGIFAAKKLTSGRVAEVESVSALNSGYWESPFTTYGAVYEADNQAIYLNGAETVKEVYVTQGQEVKAGDPLMAYDVTSLQLSVDRKQLEIDSKENDIAKAEHDLQKLKNTTPDPEYIPTPEPTAVPTPEPTAVPEPTPAPKPAKVQTEDAWNVLDSMSQKYTVKEEKEEETVKPEEAEETAVPEDTAVLEETAVPEETVQPEESPEPSPEPEEGSKENPYRFIATEEALVYGSLLNELKEQEAYAVIEIHENNRADDELISSWLINAKYLPEDLEQDASWNVLTHMPYEETAENTAEEPEKEVYEETEDTSLEDSDESYSGYTAAELAKAITEKTRELKSLDIQKRKLQLELKKLQDSLEDGIVYAKADGTVTKACSKDNPPQDGSAFLEVAGGSGVYIEGEVSELMLDQVQPGQTVYATSWETGMSYTGTVQSIDSYPDESYSSYGEGNPNSSYYAFEAYFPDSDDITVGSYLEMTFEQTDSLIDEIWLYKAYVRQDTDGTYYVMKEDGTGHLARQNVTVGKIEYGEYYQITDGITQDDYIAFPYGKSAAEGTKTTGAEEMTVDMEEGFYTEEVTESAEGSEE